MRCSGTAAAACKGIGTAAGQRVMRQVRANGLRLHLEELGSRKSLRIGLEKGGGGGNVDSHAGCDSKRGVGYEGPVTTREEREIEVMGAD